MPDFDLGRVKTQKFEKLENYFSQITQKRTRSGHRASISSDSPAGSVCYFFIIIVIRHETTAAARWALLLFVRTLFNDAITVALWTGFQLCLPGYHRQSRRPAIAAPAGMF